MLSMSANTFPGDFFAMTSTGNDSPSFQMIGAHRFFDATFAPADPHAPLAGQNVFAKHNQPAILTTR
jgi:hypothetical protein